MIDAHQHFWKVDRGDYGWLDGAPELLRRDWLPADLAPLLKRFGVTRTVLVQAAPTAAETDYLLGLAGAHDFIAGVVGWLDLEADTFAADLARLKQRPKFLGLRPMLQDLDDDRWILRPKVLAALKVMQDQDIAFDILCLPRHLPHVIAAMSEVPRLRAVLDHLGKPPVASGDLAAWRAHIAGLAGLPNVYCKLSGLVTEADHANWTVADLAPYAAEAVTAFGAERILWGSDWPVCRLAGGYGDVLAAAMLALPAGLRGDPGIFGENARRFYRLA